jgi:hypothetical protein
LYGAETKAELNTEQVIDDINTQKKFLKIVTLFWHLNGRAAN